MSDYERQIVLDTETTGLEHRQGHRIIEIGCVELVNRKLTGNNYHQYLNPDREIDQGAIEVHGITNEFLDDKPHFADVGKGMMDYLRGAELIIHNAAFDVGFLDAELERMDPQIPKIGEVCGVHDTLLQARKMFPGQRNDLDSLCRRFDINNSHRELHGALLDAEILADVYLLLSGGQTDLDLASDSGAAGGVSKIRRLDSNRPALKVLRASGIEQEAHNAYLDSIEKQSGSILWPR